MGGTLFEMGIRNLNRHKDKDNGNCALPLVGERWKWEKDLHEGMEEEKFIRSEQLDLRTKPWPGLVIICVWIAPILPAVGSCT